MTAFTLTPHQLRVVLLAAQGLHQPPPRPAQKPDVLEVIQAMGALQIDTISVVNRSPYFVLWSRLGAYEPRWLDDLLAEGALFEYWSHAACFLPIDAYPLYRRLMLEQAKGWQHTARWVEEHPEVVERVLAHVRSSSGVRSADFERTDGVTGTWWNWKDEKIALEQLFNLGELMIARRVGFQRVYDLRERVLPEWDDADAPPIDAVKRALIVKSVRALGATPARWVADYFRLSKRETLPLLAVLADEGALLTGTIASDDPVWQGPVYAHPDTLPIIMAAAGGDLRATHTTLLSPFDPLVWDRARGLELFDFDYKIECYTPAPKRKYGYFTLPILHHDRVIGRVDAKAHRKDGLFEIKALHIEPGIVQTDVLVAGLAEALRACAAWHNTPEVRVRAALPSAGLAGVLNAVL